MKRIGLLGVDVGHRHILHGMLELTAGNCDITLFTTEENLNGLRARGVDIDEFTVVTQDQHESYRSFLSRIESIADERLDTLYLNTIGYTLDRYLSYLRFDPECQLFARIYNTRNWFDQRVERANLRSLTYVNACNLLRMALRRRFDGVLVEYPPMAETVRRARTFDGEVLSVSPLYDISRFKPTDNEDGLRVVVPGNIQSHRRDYITVLDAFETLFDQYGDEILLDILGRPRDEYGWSIVERCQEFQQDGYQVQYETDWIDDEEFERRLAHANVILAPLVDPVTGHSLGPERYSHTKGTAVIGHALRHGIPLVVPNWFKFAWGLEDAGLRYEGDNPTALAAVLEDLCTDTTLLSSVTDHAENVRRTVFQEHEQTVKEWLT